MPRKRTDLTADGVRLQMNTGAAAGQSVFHAHLHVILKLATDMEPKSNKPRVALEQLQSTGKRSARSWSEGNKKPCMCG